MAKRRKAAKKGSGGGGAGGSHAPWAPFLFLLLIGVVVAAFLLFRDKASEWVSRVPSPESTRQPTPQPPVLPRSTQPVPPTSHESSATPEQTVVTPPKPVVPELPKTNKLETGSHDVEEPILAPKSMAERLADIGPSTRQRLKADFARVHVAYPPSTVVLCGLKRERSLEVWAGDDPDNFHPIKAYRILEVSGQLGPKLREGDRQVPEGIYRIASVNPNSKSYLSLVLDYPNETDRAHAARDGRMNLGGLLTIHGGQGSVSTIPVGPQAAEELFTLVSDTGTKGVRVILAPCDLRKGLIARPAGAPAWTDELYRQLRDEMMAMASRGG